MKVLMIITLNLKTAGNQALYNSLMGLVEAGHEVVCLQIRGEHVQPELRDLHPSISVRHRSLLPWPLRRLVLAIYRGLRTVESRLLRRRTHSPAGKESGFSYWGYQPGAPESLFQTLLDKFHWSLFQVLAVWTGWRIVRREGIDLVYGYEAWGAPAASLLGRMLKKPVVTRFQGTALLGPILDSRVKLLMFFDRVVAVKSRADLVIMTNDGTKGDEVLRRFGIPDSRILFITNGVSKDLSASRRQEMRRTLGVSPHTPLLLTVSILSIFKRVDRAVRALAKIRHSHPNAVLVVVGDGPERKPLTDLARGLGVDHAVKFVGAVPHAQVLDYYDAADVFISTYDFSSRVNPVFEALTRGCCMVALDDGSVDDLIDHGKSGVLVNLEHIEEELPAAIISLLKAPDLRAKMGANARRTADEKLMTWKQRNRIEVDRIEALVQSFRSAGEAEVESAAQRSAGRADE